MKEFMQNQIALALIVFIVIVVGAYWTMGAEAKEIIIQVVTAIGALVTGGAIERVKNSRATDKPEDKP
jgi:uncharacterized membrane protein